MHLLLIVHTFQFLVRTFSWTLIRSLAWRILEIIFFFFQNFLEILNDFSIMILLKGGAYAEPGGGRYLYIQILMGCYRWENSV